MKKTGAVLLALFTLITVPAFASAFSVTSAAAIAVIAKTNKANVNIVPVQETMKETDNKQVVKVDQDGDVKLLLDRGQNLWRIALNYTGSANNWCTIAKTSGKRCDEATMRNLFVGTIITIPQSLLKLELLPQPSAEFYNIAVSTVDRFLNDEADLQKKLADTQRELWYWRGVCALLAAVLLLVFFAAVGARKQHERKYKDLEEKVENYKKLVPGNLMDFQTHEGLTIQATITKVEFLKNDRASMDDVPGSLFGKPVVTEVECPHLQCSTRVNPNNFLSHYFKQHPAPLFVTTELPNRGNF